MDDDTTTTTTTETEQPPPPVLVRVFCDECKTKSVQGTREEVLPFANRHRAHSIWHAKETDDLTHMHELHDQELDAHAKEAAAGHALEAPIHFDSYAEESDAGELELEDAGDELERKPGAWLDGDDKPPRPKKKKKKAG